MVVAYFKVTSRHSSGDSDEKDEKLRHHSR
jgi:hypothetical protein